MLAELLFKNDNFTKIVERKALVIPVILLARKYLDVQKCEDKLTLCGVIWILIQKFPKR